jgi:mRNA interferase MazF
MTRRGDVVMVRFPFTDIQGNKVRPGLVIQNDHDNQRLRKTIVALITSNLRRMGDRSHLFVDPKHPDGASSGLIWPSLVSCNNLATIEQGDILRTLGHLSDVLLTQLNDRLKAAMEIS